MIDTLVTAIQSLCGAGLVLGIALSIYHGARPSKQSKRYNFAIANDFEPGHRRWSRGR
jgi:hypothetical protein